MVSQYALLPVDAGRIWGADVGDLVGGEERHVVVRFRFPRQTAEDTHEVRARVRWTADGEPWETQWEPVSFAYAADAACDAEPDDPAVMHWVGLHHADRVRLEAAALSRHGDTQRARGRLIEVAKRIAGYAGGDVDLLRAADELRALEAELAAAPVESMVAKEVAYQSIASSRARPDYRGH
jgi:hypothetical protein